MWNWLLTHYKYTRHTTNRLGVYIKYTTKSWARPLVVATEVLLPLARCQRCFTQSDRSLLFKWYNQQLKGRGWSKWQRFNNAKPRTPGRTCPTSHARRIQYTSALCGRRRRWAVILRLRPLYYDINFGIPGISSCMDQSTILRAHKSSTNIWILLLL